MANSGFNAEFLRAWSNEDNVCIDDVAAELNGEVKEGEKPKWTKKLVQKEATRYRQKGVNLRKFGRHTTLVKINADAANAFLATLVGTPAEEGEEASE